MRKCRECIYHRINNIGHHCAIKEIWTSDFIEIECNNFTPKHWWWQRLWLFIVKIWGDEER